jgi:prepilin-type processing-associated H-X9-DG protein
MCRLLSRLVLCGVWGCLCLSPNHVCLAQAKKAEGRPVPQAKFPLRPLQPAVKVNAAAEAGEAYEMHPVVPPLNFEIVKVGAQGEVELKEGPLMPTPDENLRATLMEGWFLGLLTGDPKQGLQGAKVIRVKVTEIEEEGRVRAEVGAAAAPQLKAGATLMLFRPVKTTTAKLKRLPDIAPLEESKQREPGLGDQAKLIQSRNNLKQIGLAMHNFHDVYGRFPPAVVNGPDGKPWHSWRVFLLPFLEESETYNQYRFDEPWDGPNNRKLLSKMPKAYSDPIHGENKDFYTHYVVPTGDDTIFSAEGAKMADKNDKSVLNGGRGIQQITDGTSNTLLAVPATPDQKIPWMKPEDFEVGISIPDLGAKDSIPTPYLMGDSRGAPVLFADGSVRTIKAGLSGEILLPLLTRNGGEVINDVVLSGQEADHHAGPPTPVIRIIQQGGETKALLELRQ